MKKLFLLLGTAILLTIISCSKDDGKRSCSELNIHDPADRPCEEYAEEFDCSCDF